MKTDETSRKQDEPARKPYESPRLEVYGDIREITNAIGMASVNDSGRPPQSRTQ